MAITLYPVKADFMAEIGDVDLSLPLPDEDRVAIKAAFF